MPQATYSHSTYGDCRRLCATTDPLPPLNGWPSEWTLAKQRTATMMGLAYAAWIAERRGRVDHAQPQPPRVRRFAGRA